MIARPSISLLQFWQRYHKVKHPSIPNSCSTPQTKMHLTNDWKHPDVVLALRVGLALEVAVVLVLQRARPVDALKRKQLWEWQFGILMMSSEFKSGLDKRLEYSLDVCMYPSTVWDTLPSFKMSYEQCSFMERENIGGHPLVWQPQMHS